MPLSKDELFRLAYDAGFRGDNLKMAVAVALAESGGNPGAYNPELAAGTAPGNGSRGLWQIYGTAHPQYNTNAAFDPVVNARAAFEVFQQAGGRFTPWSTFNNGMALSIYNILKAPSNIAGIKPPSAQGSGTGGAGLTANMGGVQGGATQEKIFADIASGQFAANAVTKIFGNVDFVSLGVFMIGLLLIVLGLVIAFRQPITNAVTTAVKTIT